MSRSAGHEYQLRDLAEAAIGACIIAFPVAATEEVWNLGTELPLGRVLLFALASTAVLAAVIYVIYQQTNVPFNVRLFARRVVGTYGISLLIAALLLFGFDRLDLFEQPLIALKRTILVAFPASFAATTIDSFSNRS